MAVIINGRSIVGGRNIVITNGRVIVDGNDVTPGDAKQITIDIQGNVEVLRVDICDRVRVGGGAGSISTQSGDVEIGGDVSGSVQTMSGDVSAEGSIAGSVTTMSGNIKHRAR